MSSNREPRTQFAFAGRRDFLQTLALSGASAVSSTTIKRYGVTRVTVAGSGAGHTATLDSPKKGVRKDIIVEGPGGSTVPFTLQTNSSAVTIGNSTNNTAVVSTSMGDQAGLQLVGLSTAAWGLLSDAPTGVSFAAATQAS